MQGKVVVNIVLSPQINQTSYNNASNHKALKPANTPLKDEFYIMGKITIPSNYGLNYN